MSSLPLSAILLFLSLVLQQLVPGVYAQASQAPPTSFGTATGSVTGTAISGSMTTAASSTASNSSASSVSTTNTADIPSLTQYSPCVNNCFFTTLGEVGCDNVVPAECYCTKANYTSLLLACMRTSCPTELSTAESLTNQFCAIASPSTSISFSITAFPSSSGSGNGSSTATSASNGSSTATSPGGSATAAGSGETSNAARGMGVGTGMVQAGMGGLVGVGLTLMGVFMGALVVL